MVTSSGGALLQTPATPAGLTTIGVTAVDAAAGAAAYGVCVGGASLGGAIAGEGPSCTGGDEAVRLLLQQRERARKHAADLEAENRRHRDVCKGQQSEVRKLQADNLRLYEKVPHGRA